MTGIDLYTEATWPQILLTQSRLQWRRLKVREEQGLVVFTVKLSAEKLNCLKSLFNTQCQLVIHEKIPPTLNVNNILQDLNLWSDADTFWSYFQRCIVRFFCLSLKFPACSDNESLICQWFHSTTQKLLFSFVCFSLVFVPYILTPAVRVK